MLQATFGQTTPEERVLRTRSALRAFTEDDIRQPLRVVPVIRYGQPGRLFLMNGKPVLLLSHAAATIFGLSLIAAGLSSTVVGTLAGQVVMQGFIRFHIPLWFRRTITMLPSFVVILLGLDPTRILVMSQVLLSFGIALALVPLLIFTSNAKLMGDLVNTRWVRGIGWAIVAIVVSLNGWLIVGSLLGVD